MPKYSYIQLTSIQVGFLINLSALIFGYSIAQLYNPFNAFIGTMLAGIVLFLLSCIAYPLMERYPNKNTIEIISHFFSPLGQKIAQVAFLISMIGWYCIQLVITSKSIEHISINQYLVIILLGSSIIFIVLKGIEGISKFSDLCFIPMILTILYGIYTIFNKTIIVNQYKISEISLPSILKSSIIALSSMICLVIDNPTFYQYAKSKKDAFIIFRSENPMGFKPGDETTPQRINPYA